MVLGLIVKHLIQVLDDKFNYSDISFSATFNPTYPKWGRSQTRVSCRPSCALGVGMQRIKRLEHVLYIC
jgi:hypothetical protein